MIMINGLEIHIVKGAMAQMKADAVVIPADNGLKTEKDHPAAPGDTVITAPGPQGTRYAIHIVDAAAGHRKDEGLVRKMTWNVLCAAQDESISSLAFCALGCGDDGLSAEASAKIMAQEVFRYARDIERPSLKKIIFVLDSDDIFAVFKKNVESYLGYMAHKLSAGPYLTVDGIIEYQGGIVLIKRRNPPFGWAIPGGFVDYGESVETAAAREVKEETGLTFTDFTLFKVCSDPGRDPRFHTVAVVFSGKGEGALRAADDAADAGIFKKDSLPPDMAFDHSQIIEEYFRKRGS